MPPRKAAKSTTDVTMELTIPDPPAEPSVGALIQSAIDKGTDPEAMSKLMDLFERVERSKAKKEYFAAMADFQNSIGAISKDSKGAFGKFASFEHIMETIGPKAAAHGFSFHFDPKIEENKVGMCLTIRHRGGHEVKGEPFTVPIDTAGRMNASQKVGSAASYAKRYALVGALCLSIGEFDNDGGAADAANADVIDEKQAANVAAMMDELDAERQKGFLEYMNVKIVEQIPKRDYCKATNVLNAARRG